MSYRIKYESEQKIGNCYFLYDTESCQGRRRAMFRCGVDGCDNIFDWYIASVKNGVKRSCGCDSLTPGLKLNYLPEYCVWQRIKQRCYNPNTPSYQWYNSAGITMYDEWLNNFRSFLIYISELDGYNHHDIGRGGITLDRIDSTGNYEPGNLRWVDNHTQSANRGLFKCNTLGYTGIYEIGGLYYVKIKVRGLDIELGSHPTIKLAVEARNRFITRNGLGEYKTQSFKENDK